MVICVFTAAVRYCLGWSRAGPLWTSSVPTKKFWHDFRIQRLSQKDSYDKCYSNEPTWTSQRMA